MAIFASAPQLRPHRRERGLFLHEVGGFDVRVGPDYEELAPLVLADGPSEDLARLRALRGLLYEPAAVYHALGGDEDALGVQDVQ